jgi:hypothetical protein
MRRDRVYQGLFSGLARLLLSGYLKRISLPLKLMLWFAWFPVSMLSAQPEKSSGPDKIRGIYGSPEAFWKKSMRLPHLGVNAVFMHSGSITDSIVSKLKADGIKLYAEFATLNGKGYVENHPEAWPIDKHGNKAEAATWFMGVCPTEPGFRSHRIDELKKLLTRFDIDGVWMDYLHWHAQFEDAEPILPETCFCDHCIRTFEVYSQLNIPAGSTAEKARWILERHDSSWRSWRCTVIAGWVKEFRKVLQEEKPGALLGIYHCPWDDKDFNGARRYNLGIDYRLLRDQADVFSPMVYHGRMGRSAEWVRENIAWFCKELGVQTGQFPKVWPIVQAYNDPNRISAEEFETVLRHGAGNGASGVMMFTSGAVAEDPAKVKVMKKVFTE